MIKNILLIILTLLSGVYIYKYYSFEAHISRMVESVSVKPPTASSTYRDSDGVQHVGSRDDLSTYTHKEAVKQSSFIKPYIDTLSKALDIPREQVSGAGTLSLEVASQRIQFLEKTVDSLKRVTTYSYKDKHLAVTVRPAATDSSKGDFDFSYDADVNMVKYWKPRKVLGIRVAKDYYTDISVNDPRVTIKGMSKLTIQQPEKTTFKLNASTQYQVGSGLSLGPTLEVEFRPVTLTGGAYYNIQQHAWQPTISVDYSVASF